MGCCEGRPQKPDEPPTVPEDPAVDITPDPLCRLSTGSTRTEALASRASAALAHACIDSVAARGAAGG